MQPTRRRWLSITGVGLGVGVAGCLSSGSNITYPESDSESNDGSESDADDPDSGSSDSDSEDSEESDSVTPINTRLADETNTVYNELRWFETEYDDTMREYKGHVREVHNELKLLREALASDGRIEADSLAAVETFADEVAASVNDIPEPQFTRHLNFRVINENRFPVVERFRRREDWQRVDDELRQLSRIYGNASTDETIRKRYSPNPIDNRLYGWLTGTQTGKLFEVRHVSDDPEAHEDADQRLPGHGVYIVDDSDREIKYLDRPLGGPQWDLLSSLNDDFDQFDEPTDRRYRLYVRIHDVDIQSGDESDDESDDDEIDPTETNSVPLFGQRYESLAAADAAFDAVMSDKDIEDTIQWGQETWNRILYTDEGRVYAHFLQAGAFLFVVNPSRTAWEERADDWDGPILGTWLNPEPDNS